MDTTKTKVIVVGAGMAGPVLATFLKLKGYNPILYERSPEFSNAGLAHAMQANGLRVLNLIPGLFERVQNAGRPLKKMIQIDATGAGDNVLGEIDFAELQKDAGFATIGIKRAVLHDLLLTVAKEHGIEVRWGHQAVSFEQEEDKVHVGFANGFKDTASFVVGCDGLHSNTRTSLFGYEKADFLGVVQTGGLTPSKFAFEKDAMLDMYHEGKHMVSYSYNDHMNAWAITSCEEEHKEDWRAQDDHIANAVKDPNSRLSQWGPASKANDLVTNAQKIIKYGLYDRPELKTWYKGRIVLLGDAAHPTSPHLGQGANQSFEDVYHLVRVLYKFNPDAGQPSTETLSKAFAEYEGVRLHRTTQMVQGARERGESRVLEDPEAIRARNKALRESLSDEGFKQRLVDVVSGPFSGESELGPLGL
ncbi:FAD/NAD(P)-binding domain-containing protein [Coniophora puteana RWD-64-598 SS2]|uniref:FAD/NAD(P)-binding domain-containing protein n=1 Tax=Coniophora puteana (strain RWD-64-598) TaxID=741705 RepID=A0A5M3MVU8_CONPW|nr:FAD/NAD(P)-binding domain-containing protein [Coniophora puteana RWD-64-598 SS2]EIW83288.1 FAD/NAD(P)-binding domain-containing protein [Coniophora puteana RWD-64-598 SS2]